MTEDELTRLGGMGGDTPGIYGDVQGGGADAPMPERDWEDFVTKLNADHGLVRNEVVRIAEANDGYGEEGGNNKGRFIEAIGGKQGSEWCAAVAGYCYERAHQGLGLEMPFQRSAGAKRLVKNLGAVGSRYTDVGRALPGDLVGFHRRSGSLIEAIRSWRGHVGIVLAVEFHGMFTRVTTKEGNVGGYPAEFEDFVYEVDIDDVWWRLDRGGKRTRCRFWSFATLRKGVA